MSMSELVIVIPGEPVAQARPRFSKGGHAYTDAKSRSWKGTAQVHYLEAMAKAGLQEPAFAGPVEVLVLAVFACPKSHTRKKGPPLPRRPFTGRRDWDNIGKAVCDAGNGVLWTDDAQVFYGSVTRIYGAQGEAAHVVVKVGTVDSGRQEAAAAFYAAYVEPPRRLVEA